MTEDLSRYHRPVSELFPTATEWDSYRLSDEQVRFYREHGYLAGIRMLNDDQVSARFIIRSTSMVRMQTAF